MSNVLWSIYLEIRTDVLQGVIVAIPYRTRAQDQFLSILLVPRFIHPYIILPVPILATSIQQIDDDLPCSIRSNIHMHWGLGH
jgi:hypothetical protein